MDRAVSHEEIIELLGAYALDAVDGDEAAMVASHVITCPRCAREVDEHRSTAALLAHQGSDAPAALWDRISAQLQDGETPADASLALLPSLAGPGAGRSPDGAAGRRPRMASPTGGRRAATSAGSRRFGTDHPWLRRVVGAAAAVVIALLAVQVGRLDGRVGSLSAAAAHQGMPALAEAALADPQAERIALVSAAAPRQSVGDLVILPDGSAFLVEAHLAPLPAGRTYQLWGMNRGQAVSLGLLGRDPRVAAFDIAAAAPVTSFAITAEPAGGVVMATTPPVAVGAVHST